MLIFQREFRRNLKALLLWGIALGGMIVLMLSVYSQMAAQQDQLKQLMEAYPESLRKAFGMDQLDMSTLIGYYGVEVYNFTTLFGSIYAAMLGSGILAKEENDKTIEFLLSKPVTRTRIVSEKLLAVIVNLVLFNGLLVLASLCGFQFAKEGDVPWDTFLFLTLATVLLHTAFAAVSFLLSAIMKKTRAILSISLGIVLLSYFLDTLSGMAQKVEKLGYASFFHYVGAADVIQDLAVGWPALAVMGTTILLGIGLAYRIYQKKDIAA